MARIRTIKPSFFTDQVLAGLPLTTRLTYIGLWTHVDDAGRAVDDARLVKAALWPLDDGQTVKKVDQDLARLAGVGRIERYEVDGRRYLAVLRWDHQRINRPQPSSLPPPPSRTDHSVNPHGAISDGSHQEGKGKEGNEERNGSSSRPPTDSARAAAAKGDGTKTKHRPRALMLGSRMATCIQDSGGKPTEEVNEVATWALGQLDYRLADSIVGGAMERNGKPRSARYFATVLFDQGTAAGVDMTRYEAAK